MAIYNPENERIKRKYLAYLKEAMGHSEATRDAVAKAISRFEEYTRCKSFKAFHQQQAIGFKRRLAEQTGRKSGARLSKATLHMTLTQLKHFFFWLAGQPGFRARLQYSDSNYFNLSDKEVRIATAQREPKGPTLEQARYVIGSMPHGTEIELRDRALLALTLLTGARVSAIASMKLKHVDLRAGCIRQDPNEVKTKFSKSLTTFFMPVGEGILEIFGDWVRYLREDKMWGNDDPLFPATRMVLGSSRQFEVAGLERAHWSGTTSIRRIFRSAFESADLPYCHPHSVRHTLARLGEQVCSSAEEFKAWSQNLSHDSVMTTLRSYGKVAMDRQGEIIRSLSMVRKPAQPSAEELVEAALKKLGALRGIGPTSL